MAATMGQLGVYLPRVLTNPSTVAVQPVNQANGLTNPEQQGTVQTVNQAAGLANPVQQNVVPTVGAASAGVQQTPGLASSGPQPNTNAIPVGLESPTQEAATVQIPVEPNLTPEPGNFI